MRRKEKLHEKSWKRNDRKEKIWEKKILEKGKEKQGGKREEGRKNFGKILEEE